MLQCLPLWIMPDFLTKCTSLCKNSSQVSVIQWITSWRHAVCSWPSTFPIPLPFSLNFLFLYCHMVSTPHFIQFSAQISYERKHPKNFKKLHSSSNLEILPYLSFLLTLITIIFKIFLFPYSLLSPIRMLISWKQQNCFSCLVL